MIQAMEYKWSIGMRKLSPVAVLAWERNVNPDLNHVQ